MAEKKRPANGPLGRKSAMTSALGGKRCDGSATSHEPNIGEGSAEGNMTLSYRRVGYARRGQVRTDCSGERFRAMRGDCRRRPTGNVGQKA
jgi:hypothetical protein